MNPPLIGITTLHRNQENRFNILATYVDAVRRAGGIPLLIPPGDPHQDYLVSALDGFIFSGGGDIDPSLYGGKNHPTIFKVFPKRDASEIGLTRRIIQRQKPTLFVCRGIQILNVTLGGTIIEDIPDAIGEEIIHRAPERKPSEHLIRVDPHSRLAKILGKTEFNAASWHHQSIKEAAPDLKIVAHAPDGTIEGVEMPGCPWCIAVQWHPEITAAEDPIQQRLFNALVRQARGGGAGE